jgi:CHAT domain-containing protein/tetratricopeptide (TPR) repeat protein
VQIGMRRTLWVVFCLFAVTSLAVRAAPSDEWKKLDADARALLRQGNHAEGVVAGQKSLAFAEQAFGQEHPAVATSLNTLADLHKAQGQFAAAEPLLKRALAIREKTLGADHPDTGRILFSLGGLYYSQGQFSQAEPPYRKALAIAEKAYGPRHTNVASILNGYGNLLKAQGQFAAAEPLLKRALEIREGALGPDHSDTAQSVDVLAGLYQSQGQFARAEALFERSLAIAEKTYGPDHPSVASASTNLARIYIAQARYVGAEPLLNRALTIREKTPGPEHPATGQTLGDLGNLHYMQGHYAQAEAFYKRALAISEKAQGADHPSTIQPVAQLARVYQSQGQYAKAEPLFKRALATSEKAYGLEHVAVANVLSGLASLYRARGQYDEAVPLMNRALAILEKTYGPEHYNLITPLQELGSISIAQHNYAKAETQLQRAATISERALGGQHPRTAQCISALAELHERQGQNEAAEALHRRALAIYEGSLGPEHASVALLLDKLAGLMQIKDQYAEAESYYKRALAIYRNAVGPDHPYLIANYGNLVRLYWRQKQWLQGLDMARQANAILRRRVVDAGLDESVTREIQKGRDTLVRHLALLAANPERLSPVVVTDEALQVVQVLQASGTAQAVGKMAARFAGNSDALAALAKRRQDVADERARSEGRLMGSVGLPPGERNPAAEQSLRERIAQSSKDLDAIDAELTKKFPAYQELTHPEPLSLASLQRLLRPGEAMVVYAIEESSSFAWVITPTQANFRTLPVKRQALAEQVSRIRYQMELDPAGQPQPVSLDVLHQLHQALVAPLAKELAGAKHLLSVPAGPLQSLPMGVLVASPPPRIGSEADYRQVDWLAKRFAISVLPSVGSIQAFREFAKKGRGGEPFAGIGDPLVGERTAPTRGKPKLAVTTVFGSAGTATRGVGELASLEAIRSAPRLPETADELKAMAKTLKATTDDLWLQDRATETQVKQANLSRYRTVAFATHGIMAGEIDGVGEPGLILTPPRTASAVDDGYLSASEVAQLNLNADWVVLSACNTAAADGTPGAEGLSGLAKAFFYAGARTLLVSHWPVASEATVLLTTTMLRLADANPALGKAEAHRQSMLRLLDTLDHPEYAHPVFWAPFVVVGEGGSAR